MVTKFLAILINLVVACVSFAHAGIPNRFLIFDLKLGLSQNSVTCFFEDKKGLMWIGTQDGLNSFDGKTFKQYRCQPDDSNSLSNQYIVNIAEDNNGDLWIGTAYGLNRLNPRTGKVNRLFVDIEREKKQSSSQYQQYLFDAHQHIVLLHKSQLYQIHTTSLQITKLNVDAGKQLFESIDKKRQYIVRNDSVLDLQNSQKGFSTKAQFSTKQLLKVCANQYYMLFYVQQPQGVIHVYDLKQHAFIRKIPMPSNAFDIDIQEDNTIHVCLNNGFLSIKNLSSPDYVYYDASNPQSLPPGPILSAYTDRQNNVWIGTSSSGIAVQPAVFSNFTLIPSLHKNDAIQDISFDNYETIIGSNTGIYQLQHGAMQLIQQMGSNRVNAVCSWNGLIYAAIEQKGLLIIESDGRIRQLLNTDNSALESNQIFAIKKLGNEIGLCTEKYFYTLNSRHQVSKVNIVSKAGMYSYILNCSQHINGDIYLATNSGIAVIDPQGQTKQLIPSIMPQDIFGKTIISQILPTHDTLIVSTLSNGIFVLKNNQVLQHYYNNHGLQNNVVYNVVRTNEGTLWACTNAGIARLSKREQSFTVVSVYHGLPPSYYSFGSLQANGDSIFVGTDNGLFIGDDRRMNIEASNIQAYIDQILIDGVNLTNVEHEIVMDAYKKNIEINFGHATIFDNTLFAYQLNNLPWEILPSNQKRINFSDFPLGKNTLRIKCATNLASLQHASVSTYTMFAKTPWHLRWWVILLSGGVIISGLFYAIKKYFKQKSEQKLQAFQSELKIQKERERISKDLHDNMGSYATALLSKIQQMKKKSESKDLDEMNELGNQIISNIRETIWIMQTNDIKIQDFSDKIKSYLLKLKSVYQHLNMKVIDQIEQNVSLSPTVTTNLFRIIQEAVNNSVKHAEASELIINIHSTSFIEINIEDNGIGYTPNHKANHYGVQNMMERATDIGFSFDIGQTKQGTSIRVQSKS